MLDDKIKSYVIKVFVCMEPEGERRKKKPKRDRIYAHKFIHNNHYKIYTNQMKRIWQLIEGIPYRFVDNLPQWIVAVNKNHCKLCPIVLDSRKTRSVWYRFGLELCPIFGIGFFSSSSFIIFLWNTNTS